MAIQPCHLISCAAKLFGRCCVRLPKPDAVVRAVLFQLLGPAVLPSELLRWHSLLGNPQHATHPVTLSKGDDLLASKSVTSLPPSPKLGFYRPPSRLALASSLPELLNFGGPITSRTRGTFMRDQGFTPNTLLTPLFQSAPRDTFVPFRKEKLYSQLLPP